MTTSPRRKCQIPLVRLMAFVLVCALTLSFLRATSGIWSQIGEPNSPQIHVMGDTLVAGVEAWRARHGRYPVSLAEAGLASPTRHYGGFHYSSVRGDEAFILTIGKADGMQVQHDYCSSAGTWHCHD